MPLAGSMKLNTFLAIAGVGGVVLLGAVGVGGYFALDQLQQAADEREAVREQQRQREQELAAARERQRMEDLARARAEAVQVDRTEVGEDLLEATHLAEQALNTVGSATTESAKPPPAVDTPNQRPVDAVVAGMLGKNLGTSKRKDVTRGKPYKVNVYQDDGHTVANRAKVDLDRDDKWDEKWTFADGTISRKVAPNDDEDYTVEQFWQGGDWLPR